MDTAMHARFVVLASLFLLSVPAAHAASGLVLPDLSGVFTILGDLSADQGRDDASRGFDESQELFPAVEVVSDSAIGDQRDERTAEFLVIRVGAKEVVLRDVPLKEWFAPYVRDLAELQLVSGYRDAAGIPTGTYGPADAVTLEQVAKVAVLAAGIDATSCRVPPANVSASGSWSAQYVGCAEQREWAVFADPVADLKHPATREEVVMTMLQAFEREFDVETASLTFSDVEKTGAYAPAIAKAAMDGVVSGYTDGEGNLTGTFGPKNNVTRAEFAKIVSVSLQLYGD
jgi:hypothetical protein